MTTLLSGQKVLVVEDEPVVALQLEDMLSDLGMEAVGFARTLDNALAAAGKPRFDVAVVDIDLRGQRSYPAAERLAEAGVPLVFVTGFPRERPPNRFSAAPILLKPYGIHELAHALHSVLDRPVAA